MSDTQDDPQLTPQPCPFCGSEDLRDSVSHIDLTYLCAIRCAECKTRAPTGDLVHQKHSSAKQQAYRSAVANWNRIATAGTDAEPAPRLVGDDLVELTNGVRITDEIVKTLGRTRSYRAIAELFGISFSELQDAVSLLRTGTLYSQTDTDS